MYGPGHGVECLSDVQCGGSEATFRDCHFSVTDHVDPSTDVAICCDDGMILIIEL